MIGDADHEALIRGVTLPRFPYEVLRHAAKGDFIPVFSPIVLDSARLYVQELFPDHQEALEVLLALLNSWGFPKVDHAPPSPRLQADDNPRHTQGIWLLRL